MGTEGTLSVQPESHLLLLSGLLPDSLLASTVPLFSRQNSLCVDREGLPEGTEEDICEEELALVMRSKCSVGKGHTPAPEGYKGTREPKPCSLPNITSYSPTIREASSSSSFLACGTPCGSPSIPIRLLFSLSGGMRTDTLYRSLIPLTSRQGLW